MGRHPHERGTDSGSGDNNWPKTVGVLAGWGFGHATLNGKPLYDDYEMHFMVTQGLRDRVRAFLRHRSHLEVSDARPPDEEARKADSCES